MSIYRALNLERPVIQYSILHQPGKGTAAKEYVNTILELHRSVQEESQAVQKIWNEYSTDATQRGVQAVRGNLMQFLTTPLQSDMGEVKKSLLDHMAHVIASVIPHTTLGAVASWVGRFDVDPLKTGTLKNVTLAGRKHFESLGFKLSKATPPVYESTFLVEGAVNLDVIEHIVRDRIGIYSNAHGKHIRVFEHMVIAAHNLVFHKGEWTSRDAGLEAVLYFSKGDPKYEPFRENLGHSLTKVWEEHRLDEISVWQRKLGLGAGPEFHVRLRAHSRAAAAGAVERLVTSSEDPGLREAFKHGKLAYKEIIAGTAP